MESLRDFLKSLRFIVNLSSFPKSYLSHELTLMERLGYCEDFFWRRESWEWLESTDFWPHDFYNIDSDSIGLFTIHCFIPCHVTKMKTYFMRFCTSSMKMYRLTNLLSHDLYNMDTNIELFAFYWCFTGQVTISVTVATILTIRLWAFTDPDASSNSIFTESFAFFKVF